MAPRVAATPLLVLVLACWGCAEPFEALLKRQQLVAEADEKVMEYVCPEAQQRQLEAEEPLDSLRTAISLIAISFVPAVARAADIERGCYREYAVDCNKSFWARDVLSRIDGVALRRGRDDYSGTARLWPNCSRRRVPRSAG